MFGKKDKFILHRFFGILIHTFRVTLDHYVMFFYILVKNIGMSTQEQKFYRNKGQNVQHNEYKYEFMEGVVGL